MSQYSGWLFDIYARPEQGIAIWLIGEDGKPYCFHQDFEMVFYASGGSARRDSLCRFLEARKVSLRHTRREDLFTGFLDVLEMRVPSPAAYPRIFRQVSASFPDLTFYDADIPLPLRFIASHDAFMMAYCSVEAEADGTLLNIVA